MSDSPPPRPLSPQMGLLVFGSEISGFALVGVAIDFALGTIHSIPWATLILAPLGVIAAFWHLMKFVAKKP